MNRDYAGPVADAESPEARLEVSLRLKAGRLLQGFHGPKGATGLPIRELVKLSPLAENRVTVNRLQDIEQMKESPAREVELRMVAKALGLPPQWFGYEDEDERKNAINEQMRQVLQALTAAAQERNRAREAFGKAPNAEGQ